MPVVQSGGPLSARRKLGQELRLLRDRSGMTTEEVGDHLNCSNSKVSRVELGKRACTKRDFDQLMDLFGVPESRAAELRDLMIRGRQRVPPWWHRYNDVISANYAEFLAYESEAAACFEYQPILVPALLQTEGYARAVTGVSFTALGPDQIESLVEVRLQRQERLREKLPLDIQVVVTEAALRFAVGGDEVMREQLRYVKEVTTSLDNVSFRVIPFEAGEKGTTTGAFTLFSSGKDTDADAGFTESADNTTNFRDDAVALRQMSRLFRNLSSAALPEEASIELVDRIAKERD
ncbi:helix-turn-helix domain-containing protein [Streptomyces sp. NRRL F-5053]|uniref:helix-turn-helix domain-containing protein n=1 Tax=Streptomyces sp. NRRL F-5053 TaxID=1463854 RepID=UPI0004CABCA7|nr:helix-turn-helix transcriptional regulator [Streptomyces sp. NRRL F-5053]